MEHIGPARLRALLDAVLAVASDLDLSTVLRRIVGSAAELADASYAALGVLDEAGTELVEFLTVGIDDATIANIGPYPRGHGVLGLLIIEPRPLRLPNIAEHPESYGFPPGHPPMTSFLGVPIRLRDRVFGNLYLTDKRGAEVFSDIDEEVVVTLAASAAIAIENARLHARIESMALIEDRERIARDLHDTVIQRLFATGLTLQAMTHGLPDASKERLSNAVDELDSIIREVRSAIFDLEEPVATAGPVSVITSVVAEVGRVLGFAPTLEVDPRLEGAELTQEVRHALAATLREALSNVARHADATAVNVLVQVTDEEVKLTVTDDGKGFEPGSASGGKGLPNAVARAEALGGALTVESTPGKGTALKWAAPLKTSP